MDRVVISDRIKGYILKYKYAAAILLIGLIFMVIPGKKSVSQTTAEDNRIATQQTKPASEELAEILSQIQGAGKVRVMLSVNCGEETIYQSDDQTVSETGRYSSNIKTVIVTDSQRNQTGLVKQVNPPEYLGAIILCQGADNASVRLNIMDAVSKITGLGADRISVLKMK